jgi:CheY-like chemotaxis protein
MGRRRRNLRLAEQLTRAAVMILLLDCEAARVQVAQSAAASQSLLGDLTQVRILLAEDNPVNQLLTTRLLEKRGHT